MNKVILIGNIGRDPEVKNIQSGLLVNLSIATSERGYQKQDGTKVEPRIEWHRVVLFGGNAKYGSYLHKGDKVLIEGKLRYRQYQDGSETKYMTEIVCDNIEGLSPKSHSSDRTFDAPSQYGVRQQANDSVATNQSVTTSQEEDIPF